MSFRQFGGLNYSAKNNAVSGNLNTTNLLLIKRQLGQSNSIINYASDISGNLIIYGDCNVTDDLNVGGKLTINGTLKLNGNLDISGNITCNNLTANNSISSYIIQSNNGYVNDLSCNTISCNNGYVNDLSCNNIYCSNGYVNDLSCNNIYCSNGYVNDLSCNNLQLKTLDVSGNTNLCTSSGKVGIRNSNPSYTLDVTGSIRTTDKLYYTKCLTSELTDSSYNWKSLTETKKNTLTTIDLDANSTYIVSFNFVPDQSEVYVLAIWTDNPLIYPSESIKNGDYKITSPFSNENIGYCYACAVFRNGNWDSGDSYIHGGSCNVIIKNGSNSSFINKLYFQVYFTGDPSQTNASYNASCLLISSN
jgi:cytoskeletal protein CcmA (bactofilin family)